MKPDDARSLREAESGHAPPELVDDVFREPYDAMSPIGSPDADCSSCGEPVYEGTGSRGNRGPVHAACIDESRTPTWSEPVDPRAVFMATIFVICILGAAAVIALCVWSHP